MVDDERGDGAFAAGPDPSESEALQAMLRQGRLQDGEVIARRLTERFPGHGAGWKALGLILRRQARPQEALAALQKAVALLPEDSGTHFTLGLLQRELRLLEQAAASFRRATEIDPTAAHARINLGNTLHQLAARRSGKTLFETAKQAGSAVRKQYENLPFPARDPDGERHVLRVSAPDILGKLNQYCFGGRRDFSKPFRVLVAGCGTGDSAIWLGHQLRHSPAEIIALDVSQASLEVARARAGIRELANVRFVQGSLLEVSSLGLGTFDYITCLGVLHHLPDPEAGLAALESVLADDGAMAIMLYGAVGRAPVYAMQRILRRLTAGLEDPRRKLAFARQLLENLPPSNGLRMHLGMEAIRRYYLQDDTDLWDTFLHEQDRAYKASEVREFLASAGLHLQAYISYQGVDAVSSLQYDLDLYVTDAAQRERLRTLPVAEREDMAEALDGSLALHTVYATRAAHASQDPTADDAILAPMSQRARLIISLLSQSGQPLTLSLRNGMTLPYNPSPLTRSFLANLDGHRDNAALARLLGFETDHDARKQLQRDLEIPVALHWILARTRTGSPVELLPDHTTLSTPLRHSEPTSLPV